MGTINDDDDDDDDGDDDVVVDGDNDVMGMIIKTTIYQSRN